MTKIVFVSAGAPRHGANLQRQVQQIADSSGWGWETSYISWEAASATPPPVGSWVWNVGNFGTFFEWARFLRDSGVRLIAHWIGTDLLQHKGSNAPFWAANIHIADAPHLVYEAVDLTGRNVGYVRSIPPRVLSPSPITRWDRVLGYVPVGREDFFMYSHVREIATDFPALEFHLMRPGLSNAAVEGNVHEYPEIGPEEADRLGESAFCYLRLCQHDGIGLTLIEMAQRGRWNLHPNANLFGVLHADSVGMAEAWLDWLVERRKEPNPDIASHYAREYSLEALEGDLDGLRRQMESVPKP